jgi:hypothetical protein
MPKPKSVNGFDFTTVGEAEGYTEEDLMEAEVVVDALILGPLNN